MRVISHRCDINPVCDSSGLTRRNPTDMAHSAKNDPARREDAVKAPKAPRRVGPHLEPSFRGPRAATDPPHQENPEAAPTGVLAVAPDLYLSTLSWSQRSKRGLTTTPVTGLYHPTKWR